jgi:epoxyqueuosine reductase
MRCQTVCPENRGFVRWFEDRAEFSEEETKLFARSVPFKQLPLETATKLRSLQINEEYALLCRNLRMVMQSAAA